MTTFDDGKVDLQEGERAMLELGDTPGCLTVCSINCCWERTECAGTKGNARPSHPGASGSQAEIIGRLDPRPWLARVICQSDETVEDIEVFLSKSSAAARARQRKGGWTVKVNCHNADSSMVNAQDMLGNIRPGEHRDEHPEKDSLDVRLWYRNEPADPGSSLLSRHVGGECYSVLVGGT